MERARAAKAHDAYLRLTEEVQHANRRLTAELQSLRAELVTSEGETRSSRQRSHGLLVSQRAELQRVWPHRAAPHRHHPSRIRRGEHAPIR